MEMENPFKGKIQYSKLANSQIFYSELEEDMMILFSPLASYFKDVFIMLKPNIYPSVTQQRLEFSFFQRLGAKLSVWF